MLQPQAQLYPIVLASDITNAKFPIGTWITIQDGVKGSPIGLLLSLTRTPLYYRGVATIDGPRRLNG